MRSNSLQLISSSPALVEKHGLKQTQDLKCFWLFSPHCLPHWWKQLQTSSEDPCGYCSCLASRVCAQLWRRVQHFVTPWTVVLQAPLPMGFSRGEYWNRVPFPPPAPGDLNNPVTEPTSAESPASAGGGFVTVPPGNPDIWEEAADWGANCDFVYLYRFINQQLHKHPNTCIKATALSSSNYFCFTDTNLTYFYLNSLKWK